MRNLICGAMLFACCRVSLAVEPAIPVPPTPTPAATSSAASIPLPTPAVSAAAPIEAATSAVPAADCPIGYLSNDPGVWYRPEAVVPPANEGLHVRYPYYSYRRPWYPPGPAGLNVTIIW